MHAEFEVKAKSIIAANAGNKNSPTRSYPRAKATRLYAPRYYGEFLELKISVNAIHPWSKDQGFLADFHVKRIGLLGKL